MSRALRVILRCAVAITGALPRRALPALGAVLGWVFADVLRVRRAHVLGAMRAAGLPDAKRAAGEMYRSLATSALEFLHLAARGDGAIEHVDIDPASHASWRAALGRGRGVVIASSHTGNWDLAACAVARDVELLVVTKRLRVRALDELWQSVRARRGVRLAEARGALARARPVLARGGAVAMMIDQAPDSAGRATEVLFLGQRAHVDRAPAALAAASRAPLVVAASRRLAGGRQRLYVLDVLEPPRRPSREWVAQATARATERLEAFVRTYPSEWLWLHRRWKRLDRDPRRGTLAVPCRT